MPNGAAVGIACGCHTRAAADGAENSLVIIDAKRLMTTSPVFGSPSITFISCSPLICSSSVRSWQTVSARRDRSPSSTAAQPKTSPLFITRSMGCSAVPSTMSCRTLPDRTTWMSSA
jgi:hypothetical protein